MAQKKRHQEKPDQGQRGTRNLERTDAQKETTDALGRQQVNKGPRPQIAAISVDGEDNRERHQKVELRTAIIPRKRRNTQENLI
jgi:hypothetical protein